MGGRKWVLLVEAALITLPVCRAQDARELKRIDTTTVASYKTDGFLEPIKCDLQSNIYVRLSPSGSGHPWWYQPIVKLSPDGKAIAFPVPQREGKTLQLMSFDPTADGGVAMLTEDSTDPHRFYIETSDDRGKFESRFALPIDLRPMQIAATNEERVLVNGFYSSPVSPEAATGTPGRPFAGLFGPTGALEREIILTEDEEEGGNGAKGSTSMGAKPTKKPSSLNFSGSSIQSSPDGNFILSRISSGGPIFVISSAGFLLNTIDPPKISGAHLSSVRLAGGYLVPLYIQKKTGTTQNEVSDVFISLLDPQSGEERVRYHHSSWELGLSLACYDKGLFTFLTTGDNGELALTRAK